MRSLFIRGTRRRENRNARIIIMHDEAVRFIYGFHETRGRDFSVTGLCSRLIGPNG